MTVSDTNYDDRHCCKAKACGWVVVVEDLRTDAEEEDGSDSTN